MHLCGQLLMGANHDGPFMVSGYHSWEARDLSVGGPQSLEDMRYS